MKFKNRKLIINKRKNKKKKLNKKYSVENKDK